MSYIQQHKSHKDEVERVEQTRLDTLTGTSSMRWGRGSNVVGRGGKRCRIHDSKNSHKSIMWSAVPITPAFTFFWLRGSGPKGVDDLYIHIWGIFFSVRPTDYPSGTPLL